MDVNIRAGKIERPYPDIDLPRWMTSKEKAVILFDDL